MRKLIFAFILFITLLPSAAWADDLRYEVSSVNGLGAVCEQGGDGAFSVVLRWNADVKGTPSSNIPGLHGDTVVKIARTDVENPNAYSYTFITNVQPQQETGQQTMQWVDNNVEAGKKYYYKVSSGDTRYATMQSPIEVKPPPPPTPSTPGGGGSSGSGNNAFPPGLFKGDPTEVEARAGYIERFLAEIIMLIPRFVHALIPMKDMTELVFSRTPGSSDPVQGLNLYTFDDGEYQAIGLLYDALRNMVPIPMTIAVVFMGVLILFGSGDTKNRATSKDYVSGIFICVLILEYGHYLWDFLFSLNYYAVEVFYSAIEGRMAMNSFIDTLCRWDTASFGMAVIAFVAVVATGIMNFHYALRKVMLAILLLIMPVVAVASIFPQTRGTFTTWLRELMANLFMQTGHAAALALFFLFTAKGVSFWILMFFMLGINGIASVVRRVIGAESLNGGAMAQMGNMMGLGAVMALSRMGQGIMGRRGASPAMDMMAGNAINPMSEIGGATSGITAGRAMGTIAKGAAMATAGLAGGALSGMATGNPSAGLMFGGFAGSKIGDKVNQFSNFVSGVSQEAAETGQSFLGTAASRMGIFDAGQIYDSESAAQIGRNMLGGSGILGGVGELAGRGVSAAARIAHNMPPGIGNVQTVQTGQALAGYRQRVTQDMTHAQQSLVNLAPQQEAAKLQLERARSPVHFPDETIRKLEVEKAQSNLQGINGQIADAKLTMLDDNYALSNPGIKQKLEEIRTAQGQESVNGGINGFSWGV